LIAAGGVALGGVVWLSQDRVETGSGSAMLACALTGVVGVLGAFLWLALSLRCPACHVKVGWAVLRTAAAGQWLMALLALEACPACGHRADGSASAQRSGSRKGSTTETSGW
jgi:hypothetical protein